MRVSKARRTKRCSSRPEQTASKLQQFAEGFNVSPEQLLVLSLQEKLAQLNEEFRNSADYILQKNSDLYGRLA